MKKNYVAAKITKIAAKAAQLLFPARCPVCDGVVKRKEGLICTGCRDRFKTVAEPFCFSCGKPLSAESSQYCNDCAGRLHKYIRGRALYEYESAAASIYRFKYGGRREYANFFGKEMAGCLEQFIRKAAPDALVPVPLSRKRLCRRGYN